MKSWRRLLNYPFKEFQNEQLIVNGTLPEALKGTLFRNTSVFLERKSFPSGHWFDGDGAILRVQFRGNLPPLGSYKFIQSEQFQEEQEKQDYIYSNVGRTYNGNFLQRLIYATKLKNTGNTSVLPLNNGSLLALWEGGYPYLLHSQTLQTFGLTDFHQRLKKNESFSAHPKVCGKTNEIFNFGITQGKTPKVNIYRIDQQGTLLERKTIEILAKRGAMIHDFILAGRYMVLFLFPIINEHLFSFLTGSKSLMDSLKYRPDQGTILLVLDRENNMEIVTNKLIDTTFYAWHYANGYVNDEGNVVFEVCAYKNFDSFQELSLKQLMSDNKLKDSLHAKLERIELDIKTGKFISRNIVANDYSDFPSVNDIDVGKKWDTTYISIGKNKDDFSQGIGRHSKGKYVSRYFQEGQYVGEPIFVQNPEKEKDIGWLLVLKHDGNLKKTFVEILDSVTLESVCSLQLPSEISLSYHGRFQIE